MTTTDADTLGVPEHSSQPAKPVPPAGVLVGIGGDPLIVGLIFFAIASVALGMALVGRPTSDLGAVIPIIVAGSGLYQLVVTVWAVILGQSLVAAIFSTFSAFWLTLAALLLGLGHGWFGIASANAVGAEELFFIAWACLFLFLTIPCLKLPLVYPLAVGLVFVAVSLAAVGAFTGATDWFTAAGASALSFGFLAFYAWVHVALTAVGVSKVPPLGRSPLR
ncbi:MAG: GPR1/FUN34/YaaH family transporter [Acidimicrobiales bacterium]